MYNVFFLGNKLHLNYLILLQKIFFDGTKSAKESKWQSKLKDVLYLKIINDKKVKLSSQF